MTERQTLEELASVFGLAPAQTAALASYIECVLAWPGNVTALRTRDQVVGTLLGDALAMLDVPQIRQPAGAAWLDLGAGAGIPGIPLAVALPAAELTLLDSASRKCAFLSEAVAATGLDGRARVVCARSEQYAAVGSPGRDAFAVVLARAVAPLPTLLELAAPLLAFGGVLLANKTGRALRDEAPAAAAVAGACGLAAEPSQPLPRSPLADSACAVYRKVAPTPARLPRRAGMAAKKPFTG
jgi:16S rRNA (guanine527-N7)-methyltransferase